MKAHEALIAWSGWDDDAPTSGTVRVGQLFPDGHVDWTELFARTNGKSLATPRQMRGADSVLGLFEDFHYLVVEERLDPEAVHRAFLAIDEYAELFNTASPIPLKDRARRTPVDG